MGYSYSAPAIASSISRKEGRGIEYSPGWRTRFSGELDEGGKKLEGNRRLPSVCEGKVLKLTHGPLGNTERYHEEGSFTWKGLIYHETAIRTGCKEEKKR